LTIKSWTRLILINADSSKDRWRALSEIRRKNIRRHITHLAARIEKPRCSNQRGRVSSGQRNYVCGPSASEFKLTSIGSENSTETQREQHEGEIISIVRRSLVDNAANVRAAAAAAFDVLQEVIGAKAIDETIPTLLEALRQPGEGSGTALQALREVMAVRPKAIYLIRF
jgi:hypothetical protein